jgi:hypothetical protein
MSTNTVDSSSYENLPEPDPIAALIGKICIVFANGNSFCARLTAIRESEELWFESKSRQTWMVKRQAVTGIRPLHNPPRRYECDA